MTEREMKYYCYLFRHPLRRIVPTLEQISIVRTQIPLLRLLKLRQTQIRPRLIPIPILDQHTSGIDAASRRAQTRKANADAISLVVKMRCILGQERVRGDDAANVAEANLPGRPNGPTMVPAEIEIEPANDHGEGGVRAHGDEEQRRVFEVGPRVHGDEDGEAGDGHCGRDQREQEAVLQLVGEEGDDEGEDEGAGPGRDAVQLGADLRVAVCPDDAGGEEGVAVGFWQSGISMYQLLEEDKWASRHLGKIVLSRCVSRLRIALRKGYVQQGTSRTGNDESEIHEAAEDEFKVFEAVENVSESDAAFAGGATLVLFKPGSDVGALVFLEPSIVLSVVKFTRRQGEIEEAFLYHFASSGKSGMVK